MSPRERSGALPGGDGVSGGLPPPASSPFCFPRSRRIRKRPEFLAVQARGARVTTPHFVLLLAAGDPSAAARLGITASKQVGNAIARNRAKRLVRETFRRLGDVLPPGIDLVVIVRPGAETLDLAAVAGEWDKVRGLLKKRAADVLRGSAPR